jgi:K+-sensing histidine kinase KdpD
MYFGLTATASIVTLHGGTVVAQRESNGGLRVAVRLPVGTDARRMGESCDQR